jgi:hypothetical protein
MHGAMGGWHEIRLTGPGREQFQLFCLLENGTPGEIARARPARPGHRGDHRAAQALADRLLRPRLPARAGARRGPPGKVGGAVQADRDLRDTGFHNLFSDDLRPGQVTQVVNQDRRVVDQWLVRFDTCLPTGTGTGSVQVFGATAGIRVRPEVTVGGFWLAWRPCVPRKLPRV